MNAIQLLFIGLGAWSCLVGFLVLGMCRQKYMKRNSSTPGRRAQELTAASSTATAAAAAKAAGAPKKA
ncbi:hypothetical protein FQN53_002983 [Emmonsiellopsis sp. PD_33]|nr:hypothetical protein FQN53_002983 [Emmonsiellopsis sp. PD_33]